MHALAAQLFRDEAGFIVSAELVLVSTIAVLGMIVGLSEVAFNVNNELEDVGSAFQSIDQGFGLAGTDGCRARVNGSSFCDQRDQCDCPFGIR